MDANESSTIRTIDFGLLVTLVHKHLSSFYRRRVEALDKLELKKVLVRKNPYLFRAVGVHDVGELIQNLLLAYSSSSDETIFGNEFFEPLARDLAKAKTADGEGVDVVVETETRISAYAVKSGTSVFNSSSRRDQEQSFLKMRNRLFKTQKQFDAVVGYSYGRRSKALKKASSFREVAGQDFWEELTGDSDCYVKILEAMQDYPDRHRLEFKAAWDRAVNRFCMEFMLNFMSADGSINWRGLLKYNSGSDVVPWKKFPRETLVPVAFDARSMHQPAFACEESTGPYSVPSIPPLLVAESGAPNRPSCGGRVALVSSPP